MAKTSGSLRSKTGGIGRDGGGNYKGTVERIGSLKELKDTQLRRTIQQGISKYESRLGTRTNVRLANLEGAYGVHVTQNGKSAGVYLDRKTFLKANVAKINSVKRSAYSSGFLNKTNKPTQHTVVHELGHATWNNHLTGKKQQSAGKEINKLYKTFKKQNPKKWGTYGKTNVNEFYAEGIAKGVLGKSDKYTKSLIKITKKYDL